MDGVLTFSEKGTRLPSLAKKHPIWHFCCSRELIFAELGKKAPFVITGALTVTNFVTCLEVIAGLRVYLKKNFKF
jgi:hypothetical protein